MIYVIGYNICESSIFFYENYKKHLSGFLQIFTRTVTTDICNTYVISYWSNDKEMWEPKNDLFYKLESVLSW